MNSFFKQSKINLYVPVYTTICKRSGRLSVDLQTVKRGAVIDIVVDSTGLKVYGEGEWKVRKYGDGKLRTWMKMHIDADETTQQIHAETLTINAVDYATEVGALVKQVTRCIRSFKADGGI